ncbi:hypothetical protein N7456_009571 [Penicillium angulare]|uniref:Uncharacterized protein n=1 Tax=Penicillium angulare TaxID=116970 RepID=A0A9W9F4W3_9EURO|nr:hypothetical protein N7456_009571 [Penicillium angulare]
MGRRQTKENIGALSKAEDNLDTFWAAVDRLMYTNASNLCDTAIEDLLSQSLILQRTPKWIEPEKPSHAFMPGLLLGNWTFQNQAKVKTQGESLPSSTFESATEDSSLQRPSPVDGQRSFPVDARALKVFRALFHNPAGTSTPGEVSWHDFLHAMTSVGFTATELHGVAWICMAIPANEVGSGKKHTVLQTASSGEKRTGTY